MATILCGRTVARHCLERIMQEVERSKSQFPCFIPRLDIIKANNRPDTEIYIRQKMNALGKVGFIARLHEFPRPTPTAIEERIHQLNADPDCHGILIQAPVMFPDKEVSNSLNFASSVVPFKDVDGLHPINLGRIASRSCMPDFFPCTALGIIELLRYYRIELSGLKAAVIGRSDIVGMPTSLLLSRLDATVTLCHSKTTNVPMILKESDIIIAAIGKPNFIQADWLRPGAVIIDVGINRMTRPDGRMKLVGDVDFDGAIKVASAITPVPGGVGPLTVAMLVRNLFHAALRARGIESKEKCMVI